MLDVFFYSLRSWKKLLRSYIATSTLLFHKALRATSVGPSSGTLTVTDSRTKRVYNIPIVHNAIRATDFRQITAAGRGADPVDQVENGLRVLDKGFLNTACMESSITLIDGKRGYIQYRNYSIDHVFMHNDFEEVAHLLLWGHLPSPTEKDSFRTALAAAANPPQCVIDVIRAFPRDALTSSMVMAGLTAYAACDEGTIGVQSGRVQYLGNMKLVDQAIVQALSSLATTIALVYCHKRGRQFTPADPNGSFIGNVLRMMGFVEPGTDKPEAKIERCLERLWILYADHEMTNSTAAFLHAASTLTDPLSCCIAGLVSGYGPLHGGAIDLAYKGFEAVQTPENVPKLIADVKAKKQRLFGYGHRIYKTTDPRIKFIRELIDEHKDAVARNPMLSVAFEIDRIANEDPYFTSRQLKANADLYGTFLYTALGFETDIITALAILSRSPGVLSHWREAMSQPPCLWRPQQIFTGSIASPTKA